MTETMNIKDNSWLIIIAIILIAMLFGYLDRDTKTVNDIKVNNSNEMIINTSQMMIDAEIEQAGGWENYQRIERINSCYDACDGYDDPDCERCANLK